MPRPSMNIRSKGQRSRSQGNKLGKHIEGDRIKTDETTVIKLVAYIVHRMSPRYLFNIKSTSLRSKVTWSQSAKGDRVAGVYPASSF